MTINRYAYAELREKALAPTATKEDRLNLLDWFDRYDIADWNGEYYDLDDGLRLFPICEETEDGDFVVVDAEIR